MSSDKLDSRHITIQKNLKQYTKGAQFDTPDSPEISPSIYELVARRRDASESHSHNSHTHDGAVDPCNESEIELHTTNLSNGCGGDSHRRYQLFPNQVAGTLPMLHSNGLLYKPLKTDLEHKFYTNIIEWLPSIKPFIPRYSGMEYIKIGRDNNSDSQVVSSFVSAESGDDDSSPPMHQINNDWSTQMFKKNRHRIRKMPFLILEDLTLKYAKPNILDLKIGIRHFPPICNTSKMDRKLRKSWCSTCRDFGVRMSGIQIFNNKHQKYDIMAKNEAMRLQKYAFCQQICSFFDHASRDTLDRFLDKLDEILQILKNEHRFRWFSCSLLFVYEGQKNKMERSECKTADGDEDSTDDSEAEEDTRDMIDLKLIDFTNFVVIGNYKKELNNNEENNDQNIDANTLRLQLNQDWDNLNEPDHGLLFGLECLIKLLCEMKQEGAIKMRNEKEWNQFTHSISHAKEALLPFGNKEEFNENTTI